jgi:molybdopterin-guanine dinucleotide biosynthesis protein A
MGADKGLLASSEGNWAQTAIDKILGLGFPVVVSVNAAQYPVYSTVFPGLELIADSPELPLAGPLLALLSIHEQRPAEDLLILACDMPLMQPSYLLQLVDQHRLHPEYDAYVFTNDGDFEPLCGLYTARSLAALTDKLLSGALHRFSMKYALERLNTFSTPLSAGQQIHFRNLNAPDDLERVPPPGQTPSSP